jgi:nitroreductase
MPVETQPDVIKALKWRYATKKFDPAKKIDEQTWAKLEEAMRLSPSSFGLQPWKFVVVTDQKVKDQLAAISFNQRQPVDCSHLVVLSRLDQLSPEYIEKYVDYNANVKKVPVESLKMHKDMMLGFASSQSKEEIESWMSRQVYIALGMLLTSAALLGVDAAPMEGLDRDGYDKLLGLPEKGCRAQVLCALGYRAADDKYSEMPKSRFPASDVIIKI